MYSVHLSAKVSEQVNRKCPPRNFTVQLSTLYTSNPKVPKLLFLSPPLFGSSAARVIVAQVYQIFTGLIAKKHLHHTTYITDVVTMNLYAISLDANESFPGSFKCA